MELATVQVRVENLKVEADIAVGSRGNPTVTNTLRNMAEVIKCHLHLKHVAKHFAVVNAAAHAPPCCMQHISVSIDAVLYCA